MSIAQATVGAQVIGYQAQIALAQGSLRLSTIPFYGSGEEAYGAMVVEMAPIAYDHEGITRFGFTVEQRGPYVVGTSFSHRTFNDLLKSNPILNRTIAVSAIVSTDYQRSTNLVFAGRVVRISDITPRTISFECEQRTKLTQTFVPKHKIDKTLFSNATMKKRIPADSEGDSMPLAFGRFLSYVPHNLFSAVSGNRIQQALNLWYPPVTARTVPIQSAADSGADRSVYAYAEAVTGTGHLAVDTGSNNPSIDGYLWLDAIQQWGRVWELAASDGLTRITDVYNNVAYALEIGKQPYVRVGIVATKFVPEESTGTIDNPEFAVDRRMENYCTVHPSARACWEVRIATGIGRLSMNTADTGSGDPDQNWEGANRPAGVASAALLAFPDNNFIPTSGLLHIALKYPGSTTANAFGIADYDVTTLNLQGMTVAGTAMIQRNCSVASTAGRTGEFDDGWAGTKWERGDFSAGGSDDGPDKAIFLAGNLDTRPMRVAIHNEMNKKVAVSAVGMLCAFKLADDRERFEKQRKKGAERDKKGFFSNFGLEDLNIISSATKWAQKLQNEDF